MLYHAQQLFVRSGYGATSMREIAFASALAPGAIYNHFATKQDILFQLMHTHMLDLLDAVAIVSKQYAPQKWWTLDSNDVHFKLRV
ncbi:MAG: helix-turn-helix domain-containing protein, partial [Pseudomonadota bacterium]